MGNRRAGGGAQEDGHPRRGQAKGYWSITLYATDPSEAAAAFVSQTSVLYGLTPGAVCYVATQPQANVDGSAYTLQVSALWLQALSDEGVPIQDSGRAGAIVALKSPAGAGPLTYGMVKPVSQFGSVQLDAGQLSKNSDGSLRLWFAPALPV